MVDWLETSCIRKSILLKTCLCPESGKSLCQTAQNPSACFSIGLSSAWGLAALEWNLGTLGLFISLPIPFPHQIKQRIWFVSSILREKNFLLVCKTNNGILAATFPCEDQQLPRTWSQSVLCSGCGDQHEFEEYVFWEVRLYWWQSQRWHRSPCMCTLSLSATLSVHRRKIFKSSYAELCGKGENILQEEFVEMLTFGFLWNTKLVE